MGLPKPNQSLAPSVCFSISPLMSLGRFGSKSGPTHVADPMPPSRSPVVSTRKMTSEKVVATVIWFFAKS